MSEMRRLHAVATGRVQGVGFRYFVYHRARALGLTGWVRNRADGAIEVLAEGNKCVLHELTLALKQGPSMAWVQAVQVQWQPVENSFTEFSIEPAAYC